MKDTGSYNVVTLKTLTERITHKEHWHDFLQGGQFWPT